MKQRHFTFLIIVLVTLANIPTVKVYAFTPLKATYNKPIKKRHAHSLLNIHKGQIQNESVNIQHARARFNDTYHSSIYSANSIDFQTITTQRTNNSSCFNNKVSAQFAPPSGKDLHQIPNPDVPMPLNNSVYYLSFCLFMYVFKKTKKKS